MQKGFWSGGLGPVRRLLKYRLAVERTPVMLTLLPKWGTANGGTTLTIRGYHFSANKTQNSVDIGGAACAIQTASTTRLTCLTSKAKRTGTFRATLRVAELGDAYRVNVTFRYVGFWSDPTTWIGKFRNASTGAPRLPGKGDAVAIQWNETIVLDVSPPPLGLLLVGGALIFDSAKDITLRAASVIVDGADARFEVGTLQSPHANRGRIVLGEARGGGGATTAYGPGAFVLRRGILDLHAPPSLTAWSALEAPAAAGERSLRVSAAEGWAPGARLVLAPSGRNHSEAEECELAGVAGAAGRRLALAAPLRFAHAAGAEVALLTRRIVLGCAPGSRCFLMAAPAATAPPGAPPLAQVRLSYVELAALGVPVADVSPAGGAASARPALLLQAAGEQRSSFVKGCALHHCKGRCVSLRHTSAMTLADNVAAFSVGHAFAVDGYGSGTRLLRNLALGATNVSAPEQSDFSCGGFHLGTAALGFDGNAAAGSAHAAVHLDLGSTLLPHERAAQERRELCARAEAFTGDGHWRSNAVHSAHVLGVKVTERGRCAGSRVVGALSNWSATQCGTGVSVDKTGSLHLRYPRLRYSGGYGEGMTNAMTNASAADDWRALGADDLRAGGRRLSRPDADHCMPMGWSATAQERRGLRCPEAAERGKVYKLLHATVLSAVDATRSNVVSYLRHASKPCLEAAACQVDKGDVRSTVAWATMGANYR